MPAGPTEIGFAYFVAAKFLGYSAFCKWNIGPQLRDSEATQPQLPNALKAGGIRTLIGVGIGAVVGLGFWKIPYLSHSNFENLTIFFILLVPIRVGEWWLLLRWVYRDFPLSLKWRAVIIGEGIIASFVLDAFALLTAIFLPGGAWVC